MALILLPNFSAADVKCSVNASPLNFGVYNTTFSTDNTTISSVSVTCDDNGGGKNQNSQGNSQVSFQLKFNSGNTGSFANRKMTAGSDYLIYNIYKDASYTQILGNGTGGMDYISNSYTLSTGSHTDNFNIYGKIQALQMVKPGSYNDVIFITVDW